MRLDSSSARCETPHPASSAMQGAPAIRAKRTPRGTGGSPEQRQRDERHSLC